MASRIVERDGTAYLIEDGKVVRTASTAAELAPEFTPPSEIKVGDRVEAGGKLGKVVAKGADIYGDSLVVRHDDNETIAYDPEDVKVSDAEEIAFATPLDEIVAAADEYEAMPSDSFEQVQAKLATARALDLRVRALASDSRLPLSDRIKLDSIVSSTTVDIHDLSQEVDDLLIAENEQYLASQPRYEISEEIGGTSDWTREDASWLDAVAAEAEAEAAEVDWDAVMTSVAVDVVENVNLEEEVTVMAAARTAYEEVRSDDEHWPALVEKVRVARVNKMVEDDKQERLAKEAAVRDEEPVEYDIDPHFFF